MVQVEAGVEKTVKSVAKVIPFPYLNSRSFRELKKVLENEDAREFYRFIAQNNLRHQALEKLERRLQDC